MKNVKNLISQLSLEYSNSHIQANTTNLNYAQFNITMFKDNGEYDYEFIIRYHYSLQEFGEREFLFD